VQYMPAIPAQQQTAADAHDRLQRQHMHLNQILLLKCAGHGEIPHNRRRRLCWHMTVQHSAFQGFSHVSLRRAALYKAPTCTVRHLQVDRRHKTRRTKLEVQPGLSSLVGCENSPLWWRLPSVADTSAHLDPV
jgi:hypothetical protein